KVYLAFVYTSSTAGAARWTLDDITLTNSTTAPAPSFFTDVNSLAFGYQAVGTTGTRTLNVTGANLTGGVTVTSSNAAFTLSKDGTTFASTVALTQAEANGVVKPVTVRFAPTVASTNYSATLTLTSAGATSQTVAVTGNTYDVAKTLEVVNWNMEWFGSPDATLGPADKNQQYTNAFTVLNALKADVYALEEVVDTVRLRNLVTQLSTANGITYAYKISEFGSYADNKADPDYITAQKLAFIYRTDMVANPSFRGLLRCAQADACAAFTPWASGRFPYSMRADVTLDGVTKKVNFVVIHAKANATATSANDYNRRKVGADLLKAELEANYASDNTLIVGDYNDVLDGTIATGVTPAISSYSAFTQDPNYLQVTLPLAQAGGRSTAGFPTVIDNVIANRNMAQYYIAGTAAIRTDVTTGIANYANTTSDHYPIFSRYSFTGVALATKGARTASLGLYPNPVTNSVRFDVPETGKDLSLSVYTTTGSLVLRGTGTVEQLNQQLSQRVAGLAAGLYVVRVVGAQQTYTDRFQKQ
ncbi:MAG: T9SS type A sorting domain-containing protein, partial [Hymenobacter sp.]